MTINWPTTAAICVITTGIFSFILWMSSLIYFPLSAGNRNTVAIDTLGDDTESDVADVRTRQLRAWDAVNKMRIEITEVKSDQRLIKKDVENILVILRGRIPPRAYRTPRED